MTDHPSSDRDELVAAYLDGEATPAERAQVEADPELLERVEILAEIATMVSQPVAPPPAEVRQAHIAAALEASNTAPNVTSLARKRRRFNTTQVAAVAAVIIALFAIPIALSGSDDDDETAGVPTAADSDGATASGDDGSGDDGGDDGGAADASVASSDERFDDDAAQELAVEAEPEPEGDAMAEAEEEAADFAPEAAPLEPFARFDPDPAPDVEALENQVRDELDDRSADADTESSDDGGDDGAGDDGAAEEAGADSQADELACVDIWLTEGVSPIFAGEVELTGTGFIAGEPVAYVVTTDGLDRFIVVFDENCGEVYADFLS